MCGISGFWGLGDDFSHELVERQVSDMADTLVHRGPDDDGVWVDAEAGVALAHRRLSILDLSEKGRQPMLSSSGRYIVAFNGEIYNHLELRKDLSDRKCSPVDWIGHSDTETLLACFETWGLESTLKKVVGMFAVALWDRKHRKLSLARDRMGEKPVYYGMQKGIFLFGSELKALKAHPAFRAEVNRDAVALLLRHSYIPAPYSIYKGIQKLPPGTILTISSINGDEAGEELPQPVAYWSLKEVAELGTRSLFAGNDVDAVEALEGLLRRSSKQQMMADVPLGAFLSGGVDSSMVVALMQAQSDRPVKTFTIGFEEVGFNEAEHAKSVAQHLGTDHTELYTSSKDAMDVIPQLPVLYDEPFSDPSQIPTFLVSKLTRQHVTVSLSGDAGDELFGGYNRYVFGPKLFKKFGWMPYSFRHNLAKLLRMFPASVWKAIGRVSSISEPAEKIRKGIDVLGARNLEAAYHHLISHWECPAEVVIGATGPQAVINDDTTLSRLSDFEHSMMYRDSMSYLPDGILVKIDRAAMATSLETRVPFLDHRVVEFAWRLPLSMKIRNGQGKWILRQILYKYVPKKLIERPKMGFSIPIDSWLRGPLREWAEGLLDETRLRREGFFHPGPIRRKWQEHLSGRRNWQYYLWDVLMFQAWMESQ